MKKLVLMAMLVGSLGAMPSPTPADAASVARACLDGAVRSCQDEFGGNDAYGTSIRGWCYLIRWGLCELF